MGRLKKAVVSFMLIMAISVCSVGANTKQADAFILGWVAKKAAKAVVTHVAKKAVSAGIKKVATGVKKGYKNKQKNFKVSTEPRRIYVKQTVKLKPLICWGNEIKWSSSNKKVATVSSKGIVKGKKAGRAVITAVPSISKKVSKIKITVKAYPKSKEKNGGSSKTKIPATPKPEKNKKPSEPSGTDEVPEQVATSQPTASPEPTQTSKPTETPEPEESDEPTETLGPEESIKPTQTPEPMATPKPEESIEPGGTLEPTQTSKPTATLEPAETQEPMNPIEPIETPEPMDEIESEDEFIITKVCYGDDVLMHAQDGDMIGLEIGDCASLKEKISDISRLKIYAALPDAVMSQEAVIDEVIWCEEPYYSSSVDSGYYEIVLKISQNGQWFYRYIFLVEDV